uniref:Uncharacterized protein n=1 Tax=Oryza brachyantha TaxID=4533 RepID=J3MQV6_ORYBR
MSLAYASRLCARAVQAAVRAEQPVTHRRPPPHAGRLSPPSSSSSGGPPAAKSVEDEVRRRAEKAEKVMHLVCWGPS